MPPPAARTYACLGRWDSECRGDHKGSGLASAPVRAMGVEKSSRYSVRSDECSEKSRSERRPADWMTGTESAIEHAHQSNGHIWTLQAASSHLQASNMCTPLVLLAPLRGIIEIARRGGHKMFHCSLPPAGAARALSLWWLLRPYRRRRRHASLQIARREPRAFGIASTPRQESQAFVDRLFFEISQSNGITN